MIIVILIRIFSKAHIVIYGFVPYALMSISNILLVCSIYSDHEVMINTSEENSARKKSLTYTVLAITSMFLILTLLDNVLNAFFLPIILAEDYGYDFLFFADCLAFSYHGLHFLVLLITNKKFNSVFKLLFHIGSSNRVSNNSKGNSTNPTNTNNITKQRTVTKIQ